ncbi:MAG: right-handed parallel beta-helix repeat-containing protein [Planctomycetota bacterium]
MSPRRLVVTFAFLAFAANCPGQTTLTVPGSHATIQAAINAAADGDTVEVAPGTYAESIDFAGKTIHVTSTGGAAVTTIDASSTTTSAVVLRTSEGVGTQLSGFTVVGGSGWGVGVADKKGGGLYATGVSLRVNDCVFSANEADVGSAVYVQQSDHIVFEDCTIEANAATEYSTFVVIHTTLLEMLRCDVLNNISNLSPLGAWLYNDLSIIDGCRFAGTTAPPDPGANGGALSVGAFTTGISATPPQAEIRNCVFEDNMFPGGGAAIALVSGTHTVEDCVFGAHPGTPLLFDGANGSVSRCLFYGSMSSGATALQTTVNPAVIDIDHCTIGDGVGFLAAIRLGGSTTATLSNTIIWDTSTQMPIGTFASTVVTATYCNILGGFPGVGNFDTDPAFTSPATGGYHLTAGSPCIDTGDPTSPLDPDGSLPDVGAFPFGILFLRGDSNTDGVLDLGDVVRILNDLFGGSGAASLCADASDANDDGGEDIADAVFLLTFLFGGGPTPPAPGQSCGADATADALDCLTASAGC